MHIIGVSSQSAGHRTLVPQLIAALEAEASKGDRSLAERIIILLTRQVWQIDWTVSPFDVVSNYFEYNISYFLRFMDFDTGDEREEDRLIREWINSRVSMRYTKEDKAQKQRILELIDELNNLRARIRKEKGW